MIKDIVQPVKRRSAAKAKSLPAFNLRHIEGLTDTTGMIQHALFSMPNRKEGYCIDDNARALLLAVLAGKNKKDQRATALLPVYLSFVHYMQGDDGYFRNFLSYAKVCVEDRGSEDSFGRTMLALGFLINQGTSHLQVMTGLDIFNRAYKHVRGLTSLRGIANTIIGVCQVIRYNFPDDLKRDMVIELSDKLIENYEANSSADWQWFEPQLTYDNAMLPLALLNAYEVTQHEQYLQVAFESMAFLESKVMVNGIVRPIGNQGWCKRGETPAQFDQQGIDVMAMILFYQQAIRITREQQYLDRMSRCHQWFLGANDLGQSLYDPSTGGCADGLHAEGINFNQGAESTLAYWISHIVVEAALEDHAS
jgi:hypothetical protein